MCQRTANEGVKARANSSPVRGRNDALNDVLLTFCIYLPIDCDRGGLEGARDVLVSSSPSVRGVRVFYFRRFLMLLLTSIFLNVIFYHYSCDYSILFYLRDRIRSNVGLFDGTIPGALLP